MERVGLLALGCLVAWLLAEAFFRLLGVGDQVELPPTFDRIAYQYYPDESELNPWVDAADTKVFRLAFVGDSFTVGAANAWQDAYPWRLQRLLNMNGDVPPVAVRVFGRNGTATADQIGLLAKALAWQPDLLIHGLFLNDPEDPHDDDREMWRDSRLPQPQTGWRLRALRASRVAGWIYLRLESRRARRAVSGHMASMYNPESKGWRKFERALSIFSSECEKHGVQIVGVIFPAMGSLFDYRGYPNGWAHQRLGEELKERQVPYLDLLDTFLGYADVRMAAFPSVDAHPSEIGHRVAARAIFEYLLAEGHIDASYQPHNTQPQDRDWLGLTRRMWNPLYP